MAIIEENWWIKSQEYTTAFSLALFRSEKIRQIKKTQKKTQQDNKKKKRKSEVKKDPKRRKYRNK